MRRSGVRFPKRLRTMTANLDRFACSGPASRATITSVKINHQVVVFDAADLSAESSFWAGVLGGLSRQGRQWDGAKRNNQGNCPCGDLHSLPHVVLADAERLRHDLA